MARRRGSVFDMLLVLPWWVGVAVGVVGYAAIILVPPLILAGTHFEGAASGFAPFGLFWLGICGIAAGGSALRSFFTSVLENAADGADGGIDLVLRKDGQRFFVQCKQWKQQTVGVKPVRELAGVIAGGDAAGGFFVTSGRYTDEATRFARSVNIELIDGDALAEMVQAAQGAEPFLMATSSGMRATTTWSDGTDVPTCPNCGSDMVGRSAKRGPRAGSQFWGCSQYPRCRGTRAV